MATIEEHRKHPANTLTARSVKATLVLAADEILALSAPDGQPRCVVRVNGPALPCRLVDNRRTTVPLVHDTVIP
jgi:hypothetical protein